MKHVLALAALCLPLISCTSSTASLEHQWNDIVLTASGRITEVKLRTTNAIKPAIDTIHRVQSGVEALGEAVDSLKEGVEKLEKVVK